MSQLACFGRIPPFGHRRAAWAHSRPGHSASSGTLRRHRPPKGQPAWQGMPSPLSAVPPHSLPSTCAMAPPVRGRGRARRRTTLWRIDRNNEEPIFVLPYTCREKCLLLLCIEAQFISKKSGFIRGRSCSIYLRPLSRNQRKGKEIFPRMSLIAQAPYDRTRTPAPYTERCRPRARAAQGHG